MYLSADRELVWLLFALVVGLVAWAAGDARAKGMLRRFAEARGLVMRHAEMRFFFKGPFTWSFTEGSRVVYHVAFHDHSGRVYEAYARCGGFFFGLFSDDVDVRWEGDEPCIAR